MPIAQPLYLQRKGYPARLDRQLIGDIFAPGVLYPGHLAPTAGGSSRTVSLAAGVAYVPGSQSVGQGTYRVYSDAPVTATIDPATTFPRLDQIVVRVYDSAEGTTSLDEARIEVIKGVEANGENLDTPIAAGVLPPNALVLARVLAPVGSGAIVDAAVRDMRRMASANSGVPIGVEVPYTGTVLPTEGGVWAWADGSLVDKTTYPVYFARTGHAYNNNVDPGNNKVRLPDKRGRSPVGATSFGVGSGGSGNDRVQITRGQGAGSRSHQHTGATPDHLHAGVDHLHGDGTLAADDHAHGISFSSGLSTAGETSPWVYGASQPNTFQLNVARGNSHTHGVDGATVGLGGSLNISGSTGAADRSLTTGGSDRSLAFTVDPADQTHPIEADNWIVRIA